MRGAVVSVTVHVALIALLLWEPVPEANSDDAAGGPGVRGGGGGGGAGQVTYIQMPAYQPPRSEITFQVERRDAPPVPEIEPRIVVRPTVARSDRRPDRQVAARIIGSGEGTGGGPGQGTGTGGGVGSGEGTGTGSDRGPGTGGGGGDFFPPSPRNMVLPPLPRPDEVKGKSFEIHFWVSEAGLVTRVTVTPRIGDSDYRERMFRVLRDYTFNPATTRDGTPIPGEVAMQITL